MGAADTEEEKFGDVSEVIPDTTTIGAAIFANLVPNEISLVLKSPSGECFETLR